ncbi:uncharacterized protein METZ01_LOCUS261521, partial [marine metagenome]
VLVLFIGRRPITNGFEFSARLGVVSTRHLVAVNSLCRSSFSSAVMSLECNQRREASHPVRET